MEKLYAKIIVDISHSAVDRAFSYIIPKDLIGEIVIGANVKVPFGKGNKLISGYVIELTDTIDFDISKLKYIDSIAKEGYNTTKQLIKLAAFLKDRYGSTMARCLKTVIPLNRQINRRINENIRLERPVEELLVEVENFRKKRNVAKVRLLETIIKNKDIKVNEALEKSNTSRTTLKSLIDNKLISIFEENSYSDNKIENKNIILADEQRYIRDRIIENIRNNKPYTYLLHGITGSGKTEVYLSVIDYMLEIGKDVIMLIPEISLTYQTVSRFYNRYGDNIGIMHSKLSDGEKHDYMARARDGKIKIIIGARSAIFTPFKNLGLVVIDEEHEDTYVSENSPKYDVKEVASYLMKESLASVILGSATPSLRSYDKAKRGEYIYCELKERRDGAKLPQTSIIDLRQELAEGNRTIFSRLLDNKIREKLEKKEQIILFINRRGFAGSISCRSCGKVVKCPRCDISLTYHKIKNSLECHYCGYAQPVISKCPECDSIHIGGFGTGTQKVEELVKKNYPEARVIRMDQDTTKNKDSYEKIFKDVYDNKCDILIGTQMIVKGHDFPNVTLVGIIAADLSLNISNYKASEKTYQLIVQASGRAGRSKKEGEVIIQSYQPKHYAVTSGANADYEEFYKYEIMYRTLSGYPPVCRMLEILISDKDEEKLINETRNLNKFIEGILDEDMEKNGPTDANIYKINNRLRKLIFIKSSEYDKIRVIRDKIEEYSSNNFMSEVNCTIN